MSTLNANNVMIRSGGILGDLSTLLASGGVLAAVVEIYYLARHKVDFLLGTIGIQTLAEDRFELATFWVAFGLLCLALATGRFIKIAFAILFIYTLYSLNGVAYQLNGTPTIDPSTMPAVSDGGSVKAYDQSSRVLKCDKGDCKNTTNDLANSRIEYHFKGGDAGNSTTISSTLPEDWEKWGQQNGYQKDFQLTGEKDDPSSTRGWCYAENPKTGKINLYSSNHATLNCLTGWRWKPPVNGS